MTVEMVLTRYADGMSVGGEFLHLLDSIYIDCNNDIGIDLTV